MTDRDSSSHCTSPSTTIDWPSSLPLFSFGDSERRGGGEHIDAREFVTVSVSSSGAVKDILEFSSCDGKIGRQ
jgi:hypothetical protein